MAKEINVRMAVDKDGVEYYTVAHIDAIDGLEVDSNLGDILENLQQQIDTLKARLDAM